MASTQISAARRDTYGDYILTTGGGLTGLRELLVGRYWYDTRFAGKGPILDLGPGRCWFTKQSPADIVAVDNSPEIVRHYEREGINIVLGDAYEIPFEDDHFEGAFCCWLYEHLDDPERAMAEFHRVLKPGGYGCIIVPSPADMNKFHEDYTHVRPFTHRSLAQLANAAGFTRHRSEPLFLAKGYGQVLQYFGRNLALRYVSFCDRYLRRLGIVNRDNLMLEVWK